MTARRLSIGLGVVAVLVAPGTPRAAEWGLIVPGTTIAAEVRERYGSPAATATETIEGHETERWVYEGEQAPTGINRLTVEFGLLSPAGFRADVVRAFRLEPRPAAFNRDTVLDGWGPPTRVGRDGDRQIFFYQDGLLVYFRADGHTIELMVFTMPQREP